MSLQLLVYRTAYPIQDTAEITEQFLQRIKTRTTLTQFILSRDVYNNVFS